MRESCCPGALRTGAGAGALDEELEGLAVLHEGADEPLEHRPVEAVPLRTQGGLVWEGVDGGDGHKYTEKFKQGSMLGSCV